MPVSFDPQISGPGLTLALARLPRRDDLSGLVSQVCAAPCRGVSFNAAADLKAHPEGWAGGASHAPIRATRIVLAAALHIGILLACVPRK